MNQWDEKDNNLYPDWINIDVLKINDNPRSLISFVGFSPGWWANEKKRDFKYLNKLTSTKSDSVGLLIINAPIYSRVLIHVSSWNVDKGDITVFNAARLYRATCAYSDFSNPQMAWIEAVNKRKKNNKFMTSPKKNRVQEILHSQGFRGNSEFSHEGCDLSFTDESLFWLMRRDFDQIQ